MAAMSADGAPGKDATTLVTELYKVIYRSASEEALGMRLKYFSALSQLSEHVPSSQQAVANLLGLDANSVVLILNEFEEAGLVVRRRDPADRRRHIVDLTDKGRQALVKGARALASVEDKVLAGLSQSERAELRRLLAKAISGAPAPVG